MYIKTISADTLIKEQIFEELKRKILTLELEPGSALDEKSLSEIYDISRTPLRDILRHLEGEGYVEIIANRGAAVSSMSHRALRDFFATAPMIYGAIGQLAAINARPVQITQLKTTQQKFLKAIEVGQDDDKVFYNQQFHSIMGDMADNAYLQPSYNRLLIDHARISQTFYRPQNSGMEARMKQAATHHDDMIEAIETANETKISALIEDHWRLSKEVIEYFVKPDPLAFSLDKNLPNKL